MYTRTHIRTCHGVYLLGCVSWCALVGLCVMVYTCWVVCHGVHLLGCVSWCVLVGLCVMVCTCWLVRHGVYLLACVSWCVLVVMVMGVGRGLEVGGGAIARSRGLEAVVHT